MGGMSLSSVLTAPTGAESAPYEGTVRWTGYGIPHVTANNWSELGYGYGFEAATDDRCVIAEEYVTAGGKRSGYLGPEGRYALTSNGQSYANL